jgi:hypothetical protein
MAENKDKKKDRNEYVRRYLKAKRVAAGLWCKEHPDFLQKEMAKK